MQHVFGLAESEAHAVLAVSELIQAGFPKTSLSLLFPEKFGTGQFGILGGAMGLLGAAAPVMIPGAGPFIAVGPLFAAVKGPAEGDLAAALIGLRLPDHEAKLYEEKLTEGSILIALRVNQEKERETAYRILKNTELHDIAASWTLAA